MKQLNRSNLFNLWEERVEVERHADILARDIEDELTKHFNQDVEVYFTEDLSGLCIATGESRDFVWTERIMLKSPFSMSSGSIELCLMLDSKETYDKILNLLGVE